MTEEQGKPWTEGRRSQRIVLRLRVLIYGNQEDGIPFQEESFTASVNAHGALVFIGHAVKHRQKLMLMNPATEEEIACEVAYMGPVRGGKTEVGVEFTHPSERFWRISFPPVDWKPTPRSRKA